jgi:hypothetical protein
MTNSVPTYYPPPQAATATSKPLVAKVFVPPSGSTASVAVVAPVAQAQTNWQEVQQKPTHVVNYEPKPLDIALTHPVPEVSKVQINVSLNDQLSASISDASTQPVENSFVPSEYEITNEAAVVINHTVDEQSLSSANATAETHQTISIEQGKFILLN